MWSAGPLTISMCLDQFVPQELTEFKPLSLQQNIIHQTKHVYICCVHTLYVTTTIAIKNKYYLKQAFFGCFKCFRVAKMLIDLALVTNIEVFDINHYSTIDMHIIALQMVFNHNSVSLLSTPERLIMPANPYIAPSRARTCM